MSRGLSFISVSDLMFFLENNGFYPRTEDLEAILRRCDHDADRALSFDEFIEVTEIPTSSGSDNDKNSFDNATPLKQSPSKVQFEEESIERLREEQAKREKEWREEAEKREKEELEEA